MMKRMAILAVDIATSGTKAMAYSEDGRRLCEGRAAHVLSTPAPGYAEQDMQQLFDAFVSAVRSAVMNLPSQFSVGCISLGGVMHSVVGLNATHDPVTPVLIWPDTRSAVVAGQARAQFGLGLYQNTGVPLHAMLPLTKIAWLRQQQPDVFIQVHRFVSIKEYILERLTGVAAVDVSTAAASGLYNLHTQSWDDAALTFAGIESSQLNPPCACTAMFPLADTAKSLLSLTNGVMVVAGSTDGILANLGSGAYLTTDVGVTLGSSGAVRRLVREPQLDADGRTFCYPLADGLYVVGGPSNAGGIVWKWVLEQFAPQHVGDTDDAVWNAIAATEAGSSGLLFFPYLTGERAPIWDDTIRAAYVGLSLHHGLPHIWRAAAEGMAYSLAAIYQIIANMGPSPRRLLASGGFFRQPVWSQLAADVLGVPITLVDDDESSARGSFLLAMAALEGQPLQQMAATFAPSGHIQYHPNGAGTADYQQRLERFMQLIPLLQARGSATLDQPQ